MPEATKIRLSDSDRAKVKAGRERLELSQTEAAMLAWPDTVSTSSKTLWARMEGDSSRAFASETLLPALAVVGLGLSELKLKKAKA